MKLWDNAASPYAFKVRATLYEKGIECEKADLRYHSQRAELLRFNPRGEVPALVDGAAVIYDSRVICDYLEDTHPAPALLPTEPAVRARCRILETIADTQLDAEASLDSAVDFQIAARVMVGVASVSTALGVVLLVIDLNDGDGDADVARCRGGVCDVVVRF